MRVGVVAPQSEKPLGQRSSTGQYEKRDEADDAELRSKIGQQSGAGHGRVAQGLGRTLGDVVVCRGGGRGTRR
jgi:hypothetical protein